MVWMKTRNKTHIIKQKKMYISSDVNFNEKSISACQQRQEDRMFKIVLDFGERFKVDQHIIKNEQFENEEFEDASIDEEMPNSDQPAIWEQAVEEGRQLRDRSKIQPPERFGIPVTFIADQVPMTYEQAMESAPVIRYESVRILLAIAPKENYKIMKFDVKVMFDVKRMYKNISRCSSQRGTSWKIGRTRYRNYSAAFTAWSSLRGVGTINSFSS